MYILKQVAVRSQTNRQKSSEINFRFSFWNHWFHANETSKSSAQKGKTQKGTTKNNSNLSCTGQGQQACFFSNTHFPTDQEENENKMEAGQSDNQAWTFAYIIHSETQVSNMFALQLISPAEENLRGPEHTFFIFMNYYLYEGGKFGYHSRALSRVSLKALAHTRRYSGQPRKRAGAPHACKIQQKEQTHMEEEQQSVKWFVVRSVGVFLLCVWMSQRLFIVKLHRDNKRVVSTELAWYIHQRHSHNRAQSGRTYRSIRKLEKKEP